MALYFLHPGQLWMMDFTNLLSFGIHVPYQFFILFKMQTTPVRKRLPSLLSEFNNLYSINLPNQLLLTTCEILFYIKLLNQMMINGTISDTIHGMISGTIDGMISGMVCRWRNARGIPQHTPLLD